MNPLRSTYQERLAALEQERQRLLEEILDEGHAEVTRVADHVKEVAASFGNTGIDMICTFLDGVKESYRAAVPLELRLEEFSRTCDAEAVAEPIVQEAVSVQPVSIPDGNLTVAAYRAMGVDKRAELVLGYAWSQPLGAEFRAQDFVAQHFVAGVLETEDWTYVSKSFGFLMRPARDAGIVEYGGRSGASAFTYKRVLSKEEAFLAQETSSRMELLETAVTALDEDREQITNDAVLDVLGLASQRAGMPTGVLQGLRASVRNYLRSKQYAFEDGVYLPPTA